MSRCSEGSCISTDGNDHVPVVDTFQNGRIAVPQENSEEGGHRFEEENGRNQ